MKYGFAEAPFAMMEENDAFKKAIESSMEEEQERQVNDNENSENISNNI